MGGALLALVVAAALPVVLAAPAAASGTVVTTGPWGPLVHVATVTSANGLGFSSPSGVSFDHQGHVLVADTGNNRVVKLDRAGAHVPTPALDDGSAGLSAPYGVSASVDRGPSPPPGPIVVADTGNDRLRRYDTATGWTDVAVGPLNDPKGVAWWDDDAGSPVHHVVGDTGNHRMLWEVFGDGYVSVSGSTFSPTGVSQALRFDQFGQNHRLLEFAADPANHRVVQYRDTRVYERTYGGPGTGVGKLWKPEGVHAVDDREVWVADTGNNRIQVFQANASNVVLAHFGGLGTGPGKFNKPRGIAVSTAGAVAVADTGNHRVQLFARAPAAPTATARSLASGSVRVRWTAPADGGAPITGYVVSSPDTPQTCTWTTGPLECTFTGLTNDQPYAFTVRAVNVAGQGPASAPATATPRAVPPARFHPLKPVKVFDTTTGTGGAPADLGPGASDTVAIAGVGGVPAGATAALVEVATIAPTADTSLTVWPTAQGQPATTNVSARTGESRTNLALVPLGPDGSITIANAAGSTDARVDVLGWFDDGDTAGGLVFEPQAPVPVQNSRNVPWRLRNGYIRKMNLPYNGGTPAAITLDITLHAAPQDSAVKVWVEGSHLDAVPVAHARAGEVSTSRVTLRVPAGTTYLNLYNTKPGEVPATVEIVGTATAPVPSTEALRNVGAPLRVLDSPFVVETRMVPIAGVGGVPAAATHAVVNVTARNPSAATALTVWRTGQAKPPPNLLVPAAGATTDALLVVQLGPGGTIDVANSAGTTDVTVDVVSWYEA